MFQDGMKRGIALAIGLLYLALLGFAFIVMVKPGAAFFYARYPLDPALLSPDGNALAYPFAVDTRLYDPASLLVLADGRVLERAAPEYTRALGQDTFAVDEVDEGTATVLLASEPAADATYQIYIRPRLISTNWGGRVFLLLLVGLIGFLTPLLRDPSRRALLLRSPLALVRRWPELLARPSPRAAPPPAPPRLPLLRQSAAQVVLVAFLYVFMEWLFQVTRPSFMDILSPGQKLATLLVAGLAVALLALLALAAVALLDLLLAPAFPAFRRYACRLPTALIAACLGLILLDNFTYTVLGFGIVHTRALTRVLYGLAFLAVLRAILLKMAAPPQTRPDRLASLSAAAVFSIAAVLAGLTFHPETGALSTATQPEAAARRPNIILLATDGLDAAHMSAYGYARDTTPFIRGLVPTSLLSLNHFTNASHSTGSTTALLTGRLPYATRVLFPPDTLKGSAKYEHLPGILQRAGYRTVSLGVTYYVDVRTVNLLNGFDAVNCQETSPGGLASRLSGWGYEDAAYLLATIQARIAERLGHIFFVREMENPFAAVTQQRSEQLTDEQRLACLRADLAEAQRAGQPLFAHVHLLGTHGSRFEPTRRVFSAGQEQSLEWMPDFYDDAILDFDREVQALVASLEELGLYEDTLLVLYTDHGMRGVSDQRLPLIIHFPADQHAGTLSANTQNLDIAPTILDYLGLPIPAWMDGSSLLGDLDPARVIFSAERRSTEQIISGQAVRLPAEAFGPPFYQFGNLIAIQCQRIYTFSLARATVRQEEIAGYPQPCPPDNLASLDLIRQKAAAMLEQNGFQLPEDW